MPTAVFTQAELSRFTLLISQQKRATAYYEMGTKLISLGHIKSGQQLLMQASIASYSGSFGGGALLGNAWAKKLAGTRYNIDIDNFSQAIAQNIVDAINTVT
jgi:hypothetical protein